MGGSPHFPFLESRSYRMIRLQIQTWLQVMLWKTPMSSIDSHGLSSFLSWIIIIIMDHHHVYYLLSSCFPCFPHFSCHWRWLISPSPSIRCLRGTQIMRVFSWILEQTSSEPEEKWSPEGQNIAIPWRIHGAAIYGNIWGILMVNVIYNIILYNYP